MIIYSDFVRRRCYLHKSFILVTNKGGLLTLYILH